MTVANASVKNLEESAVRYVFPTTTFWDTLCMSDRLSNNDRADMITDLRDIAFTLWRIKNAYSIDSRSMYVPHLPTLSCMYEGRIRRLSVLTVCTRTICQYYCMYSTVRLAPETVRTPDDHKSKIWMAMNPKAGLHEHVVAATRTTRWWYRRFVGSTDRNVHLCGRKSHCSEKR